MNGRRKSARPSAVGSNPSTARAARPSNPWLGKSTARVLPGNLLEINGVRGFLHPGDIERLKHYARLVPRGGTIIEVGSCMGLSAIIMAHALLSQGNHTARIHCIDSWDNKYLKDLGVFDGSDFYATFLNNIRSAGVDHVITPTRKLSTEAAPEFADGSADLLFIDADHSYEGCYADLVAWLPKLKPSGILIGHDCVPGEGVERAVKQFTSERGFPFTVMVPPRGHYMYEIDVRAAASAPPTEATKAEAAPAATAVVPQPLPVSDPATLTEPRPKRLIGLLPVRNEEAVIGQCLRSLARYTDAIVVLDDASDDGTLAVVHSLAKECRIERVLTKSTWYRDEPGDRNRMLEAGRQIGGTHFLLLDSDEMLTSNCARDGFLRRLILDLPPGDQLAMVWIHLWRSARQYRHDSSVWTNNYKTIAFADDGRCRYRSDYTHTPRTPTDLKGKTHAVPGYTYGFMHFASVNWRNVLVRLGWYHCIERLMHPDKPAAAINALYGPAKDETGIGLKEAPAEWFSGYPWFDESAFQLPCTWREAQVLGWFAEHGRERFADLNIWDVDWGAEQSIPMEQAVAAPRPAEPARVVNPLVLNGKEHMSFGTNVTIGFGARLECITSYGGRAYSPRLSIGDGTTAEMFLHIGCADRVTIGKDCMLAGHVTILDHDHGFRANAPLHGQPLTVAPVTIGDSVFVGEGAFIGKGVTVGNRAVIGAGAVVVRDVPAYAIVGGVPAKVIGSVPRLVELRKPVVTKTEPLPDTALTSIIILTYNGRDMLDACLRSIAANTPEPHEVIVVDNGSSDGTAEFLRGEAMRHTNLRVVRNEANLGFAAGNNQGMAIAGGQYIVLLNNDTLVTEGWLGRMLAHLRRRPDLGAVGPMSNRVSGPQQVPGATYNSPEEMRRFASKWVAEHDGQLEDVSRLVGFCLTMRSAVVGRIGGLDERFGSGNFEDDDFCLRAIGAGFKVAIAKDSFVHHIGGQTFELAGIDYREAMLRNWALFKQKWGLPADLELGQQMHFSLPSGDLSRYYVPLPPNQNVPELWNPLVEGEAAVERGAFDEAAIWYQRAVASYPDRLDAHEGLAVALLGAGRPDEAALGLTKAIALAPINVTLRNLLATSLFEKGDLSGAEEALLGALALDESDVQSLMNLVHLTRAQGRYAEATDYLKKVLRLDASQPEALAALATISLELGNRDAARSSLARLERVAPEHAQLPLLRRMLSDEPGEPELAVAAGQ